MDTAAVIIGIVLSVLQILGLLFGWLKFYTKIQVDFTKIAGELKSVHSKIEHIEAQYVPNGGSSMRDAINRIEAKFSKLEGRFEQHVDEQ